MIISFNYDKNILFIILFILITILNYINKLILDKYFQGIYPSISKLSFIIFYFIEKELNKNLNQSFNTLSKNNHITYKKYMIIFSSIIFYSTFFYTKNFKEQDLIWGKHTQMCFFLLIDFLFFKNERYLHQTISIIFISIFSIAIFIFLYEKFDFIFCFYFLSSYSYAFSLLILKYINTKYFISVYILGFIFGLVEIIILLINGVSFHFILNLIHIFVFIGLIGNYYFFYFIIYKLSPVHSIIFQ